MSVCKSGASTSGSGYEGDNHQYNAAGTGADPFTWNFQVPEAGAYNVMPSTSPIKTEPPP
ncbi:golvesin C-terminal-like domain-containing protein [Thermoactinomyces mirandus]|uniref:golvesin C-terminal-like domain-containing protein n=1 Tax=Thermoactinomyces mirandus TaxID=2756294 RepID=UPI00406C5807